MEEQRNLDAYIQHCYNDGSLMLIVCILREQAVLFSDVAQFMCDMTYKQAHDTDIR